MQSILKNSLQFSRISYLSAHRYVRSISQTALHYKPTTLRQLTDHENLRDRVVQSFFDTSNITITVAQAQHRLTDVTQYSTSAHSYYQLCLPFAKNQFLRKKMVQFSNSYVRTGRILQLMDYIAANVAYRYCSPKKASQIEMQELDFITVTAAIDEIDFYYPIDVERDCQFSGYVSYVGRSSMQVHIDVIQQIGHQNRLACAGKFVMVARNKKTKKGYAVPTLNIADQKEKLSVLYELAEHRQHIRKEQAKKALIIAPPSYEQSAIVHSLMLSIENKKSLGQKWVSMDSTTVKNMLLMHLEDKNLSGKIFGGYIIRLAYQLGWVCVYNFLKGASPVIIHIDDVQFVAPVEIGTSVLFQATIAQVYLKAIHVIVKCHNIKPNGSYTLTNVLRITFQHLQQQKQVAKVYPETLINNIQYIEAMRTLKKIYKR